jgi:hypothetical protein
LKINAVTTHPLTTVRQTIASISIRLLTQTNSFVTLFETPFSGSVPNTPCFKGKIQKPWYPRPELSLIETHCSYEIF